MLACLEQYCRQQYKDLVLPRLKSMIASGFILCQNVLIVFFIGMPLLPLINGAFVIPQGEPVFEIAQGIDYGAAYNFLRVIYIYILSFCSLNIMWMLCTIF